MIDGDFQVVADNSGNQFVIVGDRYVIGPNIGGGGFGQVFEAMDLDTQAIRAFKFITAFGSGDEKATKVIEGNLNEVKKIQDRNNGKIGNTDKLIRLYDIFRLPKSNSLAYIMEMADLNGKYSLRDMHRGKVTLDDEEKCNIAREIALFFKQIHRAGLSYKDINEGNLFFSKHSDLAVIDLDNLSYSVEDGVVLGTPGYIAPEIYEGAKPSKSTDRFSMAVFFYRLLIGNHFPYDGKLFEEIYLKYGNQMDPQEIFMLTRGKDAVFAFDPSDNRNTIRGLRIPYNEGKEKIYQECVERWDSMPNIIQNTFIESFVDMKKNPKHRYTDSNWIDIFDYVLKEGMVSCSCGRKTINSGKKRVKCCCCGKSIQVNKVLDHDTWKSLIYTNENEQHGNPHVQPKPQPAKYITMKIYYRNDRGEMKGKEKQFVYQEGRIIRIKDMYTSTDQSNVFQLMYSEKDNVFALKNSGDRIWKYRRNEGEHYRECKPGNLCLITNNMQIRVEKGVLELVVVGVELQ